jgi:hypothetical protein
MAKPNDEQLRLINRFTKKELTPENVSVFKCLMADDLLIEDRFFKFHGNLLRKFMQDANKGVALLMGHNSGRVPVGRSFKATLQEDFLQDGSTSLTLYGEHYIDLGRNTQDNMTTDDIANGIDAGTIFDTSVGITSNDLQCSICGNDIRDHNNCMHWPGNTYKVDSGNDDSREEVCIVIMGQSGTGELLENSLVYAGAVERATIVNFSKEDVINKKSGSILYSDKDLKRMPLGSNLFCNFSKGDAVFYTDSELRSDKMPDNMLELLSAAIAEQLAAVKEDLKTYIDKSLSKEDLEDTSEDVVNEVTEDTTEVSEEITETEDVETEDEPIIEVENSEDLAVEEIETVETIFNENSNEEVVITDEFINSNEYLELTKDEPEVENLNIETDFTNEVSETQEVNMFKKEMVDEVVKLGIRLQGNYFPVKSFSKFLETLSYSELRDIKAEFSKGSDLRYSKRVSEVKNTTTKDSELKLHESLFEDHYEWRNEIAKEARKLSKDTGKSVVDIQNELYTKYSNKEEI